MICYIENVLQRPIVLGKFLLRNLFSQCFMKYYSIDISDEKPKFYFLANKNKIRENCRTCVASMFSDPTEKICNCKNFIIGEVQKKI